MDGVIVEYKGKNRMRIVESVAERRSREYHNAKRVHRASIMKPHPTAIVSPNIEPTRKDSWHCSEYTDTKCWKNQKHAKKGWMRHLHRLEPSARSIADNCIYPQVCC